MKYYIGRIPTAPAPAEAHRLEEYSTVACIDQALEIAEYCDRADASLSDRHWAYYRKLTAIFLAGYVAGKREERARRKGAVV